MQLTQVGKNPRKNRGSGLRLPHVVSLFRPTNQEVACSNHAGRTIRTSLDWSRPPESSSHRASPSAPGECVRIMLGFGLGFRMQAASHDAGLAPELRELLKPPARLAQRPHSEPRAAFVNQQQRATPDVLAVCFESVYDNPEGVLRQQILRPKLHDAWRLAGCRPRIAEKSRSFVGTTKHVRGPRTGFLHQEQLPLSIL